MHYSKTCLSQGSQTWPQCEIIRRQLRPMRARIVYFTEKAAHHHAQNLTSGLIDTAWLLRLTGWFQIHFFIHLSLQLDYDLTGNKKESTKPRQPPIGGF